MKKRQLFTLAAIILLFCFSSAGAMARLLEVEYIIASTENIVETDTVDGVIIDESANPSRVNPGETVEKKVYAKNTGSHDMVLRMKVTKYWENRQKTESEEETGESLNADYIQLNDLGADKNIWFEGKDEEGDTCYYYRGILKTGHVTEALMTSYTLSADLDQNDYADREAQIKINLDCLQAGSEAIVNKWGVNYADLGLTDDRTVEENESEITFSKNDSEYVFQINGKSDKDLFAGLSKIVPGETYKQKITITNQVDGISEIFLSAVPMEQQGASEEEKDTIMKLLQDEIQVEVVSEEGHSLGKGSLYEVFAVKENETKTSLGAIDKGKSKEITVEFSFAADAGNEYQDLIGKVNWLFSAVVETEESEGTLGSSKSIEVPDTEVTPSEDSPITPKESVSTSSSNTGAPKTGDQVLWMFAAVSILSALILIYYVCKLYMEKRNIENNI